MQGVRFGLSIDGGVMSALRFDHIAIPVGDAASARELFGDILGLPLVAAYSGDDWDGAPWLMMIYGLVTFRITDVRWRGRHRSARRAR
jgi:catechol 2,3-dioxygenase-like lactoylglutathione lyase family enzyme